MIRREDDQFHPRNDDPFWNESTWFSLSVPEAKFHGYLYWYFRPNMNLAAGGPLLFDPTGDEIYNCIYWDWNTTQAFPDGAQMFDFTLQNSLHVETIELMKSYRMIYELNNCHIDLTWEAFMEPHEMSRVGGEVNPTFAGFWSDSGAKGLPTGHFEQGGRFRGTIEVEGRTYQVDSFSIRDRTWGPRRLRRLRLGYDWGIHSETSSFCAPSRNHLPPDEDPIAGTTEQITAGWYTKEGVTAALVSGERRILERDDTGRPLRTLIEASDELGRTLHAEGTTQSLLKWLAYSTIYCWLSPTNWEFDGNVAWGETNDYYSFDMQRRFHRSLQSQQLSTVRSSATV